MYRNSSGSAETLCKSKNIKGCSVENTFGRSRSNCASTQHASPHNVFLNEQILSGWHVDAQHDHAFADSSRNVHSLRTPPWPPLLLQELLRYKSLQSWHTTTNDHLKCKTALSFCLHISVTAITWDVLHAAQDLPGDDSTNGLPTYLFANRKQR